ncbi:MCP four helix bundle domain-containing protein, partial [Blastococcus saxobsidens]|uniref:Methyl-accepting chemotaxis protein n=1 Tax=Blastococcus saxobsidens (strain DD2) TaxID=1146883 RepID=H6RUA4_BLASD
MSASGQLRGRLRAECRGRRQWGDRGVKTKILAAVAVPAAAAGVIGILGMQAMGEATTQANSLYENNVTAVAATGDMNRLISEMRIVARDALLAPTPQETQLELEQLDRLRAEFDAVAETYTAGGLGERRQVAFDELAAALGEYELNQEELLAPLAAAGDIPQWIAVNEAEVSPLTEAMTEAVLRLRELEGEEAQTAVAAIDSSAATQTTISLIIMIVGLLIAVGVGLVVATGIARATRKVRDVTDALAQGDLTHSTGLTTRDELGQMGQALDSAVADLRSVMASVVGSADAVAASSEELSASSA